MNIPKKIKVGGRTIDVKIVEPTHPKLDNNRDNGCYSTIDNVIYLSSDCHKEQLPAVFLHEVLHAVNVDLDETIVEFLAQSLYQVLHDNSIDFG